KERQAANADQDVESVASRFFQFFYPSYEEHCKNIGSKPSLGFVFAGYKADHVGHFVQIDLPGSDKPKLLDTNTSTYAGAIFRGQIDVIVRLLKGYDPAVLEAQAVRPEQKQLFTTELGLLEYNVPYNYLMLQDGIDFALSLVQTTVDMQRFSFGTLRNKGSIPGVGGNVDVLAITPNDITWVKKKWLTAGR
ncbi:MAG TPA: hypothetical protein VMU24_11605, partial [Candidatus Acidoferrales bacterium]|nr:hypothetical protein [Candidatus Acidoferrales bacterium]